MGSVKFFGSQNISVLAANYQLVGAYRNIFAGQGGINPKSAIPAGARHPVAIQMAQKAGGLASRNAAKIILDETGAAVKGLPAFGTATVTLDVTDATGKLVIFAVGTADISFSASGSIFSIAAASGSASITITPTGTMNASAYMSGQATATISPAANISAIGYISGTSSSESEFSPAALSNAVWGTIIESGFDAQEILRLLSAVAVGNATGLEGAAPVFKDISGSKPRVTATYNNGTREITVLDAT
jgi:hypothetical protein